MEQTETPVVETTNKYELMVIFLPDLGEEAVKKELAEIKKLLSNDGGDVYHEDVWGLKDLAYRIRKQDEGYYVVLNFSLPGGKIAELEHLLNIHQTVLRYLITKTSFDYKIRTLKDYEAEAEKLDKEEQKVKDEAAARKGRKRPAEPQRAKRAEAPSKEKIEAKTRAAASAPKNAEPEKAIEKVKASEETHDEIVPKAAAERSDSASEATEPQQAKRAEAPSEEEGEAKAEETASALEDAKSKQESAPKKPKKKAEKEDLDDFDKRLKSIIDDPDISL